ncbi:sugar phosphate isomerase/epimerase family protein [Paenibacillus macquariensis]|uniref:Hexulose-6-phosphate isomerase n=1 Tax=Paenibacillus macquariensis TaxID=948756 RepID=A0ABY1JXY4_9BACL|nr:sugar phosphate isomerase/epimerase family protein [Paenibacillus macquariensis]MEC0089213.1 sugar phosphate isomerase/epimerase [Paenibacillus macquariensis]OAB33371.1 xylulose 5-phosphate 3-epimerase [Paenibacillus macquariensis subsp. macquariensis]SIQ96313.1 hexulose-6-phosphate isomerase [Paenibacillus macquariensis]
MKKGINIWSFKGDSSIADCITLAKQAGFDGIELSLNATGELSLNSGDKEVSEIKARIEDASLEIAGLATGLYWDYPMTSGNKEIQGKAIDVCKKQLELAAALEVDTILVIPGAVGVDFIPNAEVTDYERAYERALESIAELVPYAKSAGVSIGLENVWNKFLLTPLEMRSFIDEIDSTYVGSYFDVGNALQNGYPEHWIRILGHRIKKVHFKDYRRQAGGLHGFVDLLAGDVDYPVVMESLRAIGYDNYVTAEMIPPYNHYSEQIIYNTSGAMDAILGRK